MKLTLEEVMKTTTMKCARCGGELIVHPYIWEGQIKSINYCKNCWEPKSDNALSAG